MSHPRNKVLLGMVLQQAGLVSAEQVKQALKQQKEINCGLKIGEILVIQGRLNSKTADFFAERWSSLLGQKPQQPIGQYLKQAGLLNEQQIRVILDEQKKTEQKFGELAIAKGWLRRTTLDFFLKYLMSEHSERSKTIDLRPNKSVNLQEVNASPHNNNNIIAVHESVLESAAQLDSSQKVHEGFLKIKRKLLNIEDQDVHSEIALNRVLFWTGGNSHLTQKLFTLISENKNILTSGKEAKEIDYLVKTKILDNWKDSILGLHFKTIQDRLVNNRQYRPNQLLLLYQRILKEPVLADDSQEQQELLNLGLAVRQQHQLVVANRIYQAVFNLGWVIETLNHQSNNSGLEDSLPFQPQKSDTMVAPPQTRQTKNNPFKLKNILLLLTLIGLLSIFISNITKLTTVKFAFQQGNEFLKQKSFNEAIEQYNKLLNIDSNYFQAWTNRGYALAGIKKYEEMRDSCSTATIIEPSAVYAWNCLGEALHNLQKYEEAVTAFDKAIALNKTDPIFLINKSEALSALDQQKASIEAIQEAIKVLEKIEAIEGKEDIAGEFAVALTFLGNGYRKQKRYQDAINAYERATSYAPEYFPAQLGKGIALEMARRSSQAKQEFQRILENTKLSEAQHAQAWFHLGKSLCNSAQYDSGIAAFEQSIKLKPDYQIAAEAKKQCR